MPSNEAVLTEQHRLIDAGIIGLVDGSGSRKELTDAILLLRRHIYIEETVLFPVLEDDPSRTMALAQMKYEHGDMWPHIESAMNLLEANAPLDDLMADAEALVSLLQTHNAKEEEAIYSAAERYTETGSASISNLFLNNDIPIGWTCLRA